MTLGLFAPQQFVVFAVSGDVGGLCRRFGQCLEAVVVGGIPRTRGFTVAQAEVYQRKPRTICPHVGSPELLPLVIELEIPHVAVPLAGIRPFHLGAPGLHSARVVVG